MHVPPSPHSSSLMQGATVAQYGLGKKMRAKSPIPVTLSFLELSKSDNGTSSSMMHSGSPGPAHSELSAHADPTGRASPSGGVPSRSHVLPSPMYPELH